ncbi:MAG: L-threonylcarbamoyladenylate synthase [Agriterribacter sp.]
MNFMEDIENCLQVLRSGGTILYPTDTIWGLGCDATNEVAVKKIYSIKQREESKALIVLLADEREIIKYVAQPDLRVFDYLQTSAQPTTVIYKGAIGLADNLIAADGSIAIRLVKDEFCRNLIRRFKKPIVSTSANISGHPAPPFFSAVDNEIKQAVDYVVNYRRDDETPKQPSSVILWNDDGTVKVLR